MIQVLSHDPLWAMKFATESRRIAVALGEAVVGLHHIGSTAVPATRAKPVIDILLEVVSLDTLDRKTRSLEDLGYEAMGEFGISGRRYFRLGDRNGTRTHQVHAFEQGGPNVARHLAFRDYLRAHPSIAREYGELKTRLANACPHGMDSYIVGKNAFVQEHERIALIWASGAGALASVD